MLFNLLNRHYFITYEVWDDNGKAIRWGTFDCHVPKWVSKRNVASEIWEHAAKSANGDKTAIRILGVFEL